MTNNRILYWDFIRGVAIFLVVWGHTIQFLTNRYYWDNPIGVFITSLHMPLFMMISGYFAYSALHKTINNTIRKKFIQLIVPSITIYILTGLILILLKKGNYLQNITQLCIGSFSSYWFLKTLFIYYILMMCFYKTWIKNKISAILITIILLILCRNNLDYIHIISMLPYFICGLILRKYMSNNNKLNFKKHKQEYILFISSLLLYILFFSAYNIEWYNMYNNPFILNTESLYKYVIRSIIGLCGAFSLIIILREIYYRLSAIKFKRYTAHIGTMTLGIYVLHHRNLDVLSNKLFAQNIDCFNPAKGTFFEQWFYAILICIPIALIFIGLCIIAINIIRKSSISKLILLGEK